MVCRETFLQIQLRVLIISLSAGIESMEFWKRRADSLINSGNRVWNKHKIKIRDASLDRQPKIQSSSVEETLPKNYGADQQGLQISDLHFDKFPTPATFVCWKIRFKIEVCTCSQFRTEAMHWIKEVEMVDSVDDLMFSSSTRGIQISNFEVLDARIASALNRFIHKKNQSGGTTLRSRTDYSEEDRLLT